MLLIRLFLQNRAGDYFKMGILCWLVLSKPGIILELICFRLLRDLILVLLGEVFWRGGKCLSWACFGRLVGGTLFGFGKTPGCVVELLTGSVLNEEMLALIRQFVN